MGALNKTRCYVKVSGVSGPIRSQSEAEGFRSNQTQLIINHYWCCEASHNLWAWLQVELTLGRWTPVVEQEHLEPHNHSVRLEDPLENRHKPPEMIHLRPVNGYRSRFLGRGSPLRWRSRPANGCTPGNKEKEKTLDSVPSRESAATLCGPSL